MKLSKSTLWSTIVVVVVVIAVVLIVIFVPNSNNKNKSSSNASLSAAQESSDRQAALANFNKFFNLGTSMSERQTLLQNGSQFAQAMNAEFSQLSNESLNVIVNSSSLTNASTLKVNYTIELNGQPVLKDQSGEMLKINGTWQVSDSTLCTLLSLGGSAPAVCK
jgi:competence protein ComGC